MDTKVKLHRNLYVAIICGTAGLVLSSLFHHIFPGSKLPVSLLPIMLSAGALGFQGAILSSAVGIVPEAIQSGNFLIGAQATGLILTLGFASSKFQRVPLFVTTAIYWLLIAAPLAFASSWITHSSQPELWLRIWLSGFGHVFLALVAGTLLLNESVWILIARRPRLFSLQALLTHIVTILATAAMLVTMSLLHMPLWDDATITAQNDLPSLFLFTLCGIAAPALIGWRLTDIIHRGTREVLSYGLLSQPSNQGFSGLSSAYWRRKNDSIDRLEHDETNSRGRENSGSNISIPNQKGGPLAPDMGICSLDKLGTITFCNRKFCKLAAINDREIIGRKIDTVPMNQAVSQHMVQLLERTFKHGPQLTELKLNELPNNLRYFEIKSLRADAFEASSIADGPDNIIITIRDITDRRAIETSLLQAQKLTSLGSFISGVGHAFNNTLTTIVGHASFARSPEGRIHVERCLEEILNSARKAGELVRQLVDFAESKPGLLKKQDLSAVIDQRIELLRELVGDSFNLILEKTAKPVGVKCDCNLIMQAITNLVLNAKESYADKPGEIRISIDTETIDQEISSFHLGARPGTFARLRVKDQGFGMNTDVMARAFEPLFTTKGSKGKTGLGLSTVFAIVRAHDGFLTVESHPGKGTTVSVYLPQFEIEEKRAKGPEQFLGNPIPTAQPGKEHILLVEDEQNVRELVATMLTTLGYSVTSCGKPDEALEHSKSVKFDLILVDLVMPRMDGTELIQELKKVNNAARALVMTGYGPEYLAKGCKAQVLAKPFDLETLSTAVQNALHTEGNLA